MRFPQRIDCDAIRKMLSSGVRWATLSNSPVENRYTQFCSNSFYSVSSIGRALGLTGTFGVSLYTKIVDSGGDSWGRRNRTGASPMTDSETLSDGVEGGRSSLPEGGGGGPYRGDRARP